MPTTSAFPPSASPAPRTRALAENPRLANRAIELLQTFQAFVRMDADDARSVVAYLREVAYARGDLLFAAGDQRSSSYLLLLLEGEVAVDAGGTGPGAAVPISVLGAGSVLGEMALLDGAPRSATCTALSDIQAAGLSRRGLERLIDEHPKVAAKLLAGLLQRMSERLRALGEQLELYGQVSAPLPPGPDRPRG